MSDIRDASGCVKENGLPEDKTRITRAPASDEGLSLQQQQRRSRKPTTWTSKEFYFLFKRHVCFSSRGRQPAEWMTISELLYLWDANAGATAVSWHAELIGCPSLSDFDWITVINIILLPSLEVSTKAFCIRLFRYWIGNNECEFRLSIALSSLRFSDEIPWRFLCQLESALLNVNSMMDANIIDLIS